MNKEIILLLVEAIDRLNVNLWLHQGEGSAHEVRERIRRVLMLLNEEESNNEN